MHRLSKRIALLAWVLLSGCASLTSQQITQRIDTMSDFQLCLGAQTGMDSQAFDLDVAIVAAAPDAGAVKVIEFKAPAVPCT